MVFVTENYSIVPIDEDSKLVVTQEKFDFASSSRHV